MSRTDIARTRLLLSSRLWLMTLSHCCCSWGQRSFSEKYYLDRVGKNVLTKYYVPKWSILERMAGLFCSGQISNGSNRIGYPWWLENSLYPFTIEWVIRKRIYKHSYVSIYFKNQCRRSFTRIYIFSANRISQGSVSLDIIGIPYPERKEYFRLQDHDSLI